MKKTSILLSAALMFFGLTAKAQTTITFDTEDYKAIGVYDKWEESPFRTGELEGNAGIALNPSTTPDEVLGVAPNSSEKVVAFQRSRYGSNVYGVRIDLKEPIRVTKQLQYVHVMTYLKDKPTASRMMVIGLGRRLEESWSGQAGQDVEQFWSYTTTNVEPKDGWQDIVVSFKGFSYSKEENASSGIDLHALVIVPDVRTPDEDAADWVAYFDEIVVDNNPNKRFSTEQYALTYDKEAAMTRDDRAINSVGLSVGGKSYSSPGPNKKFYANNTTKSVFSAMAGAEVQPTFSYKGGWMNGYVYVDWGRDALFKDALNDNGTPAEGSDVVSYNAVQIGGDTWYKSDGTTVGSGNNIGAGVPKFTVPAGTPAGFYRMRYKVDWNSIDPAGGSTIISDGGGIVDVMLDVHGDKVAVNASQLNGDIYAADGTDLINYEVGYEQPLKVKIVPAPGFVQYGFTLKYGYNVAAKEQLDDKGNPNYIEVKVPYTEVAGDGTYTIPAEYMRGSQVSIMGDMQQEQLYTVEVEGLEEGQGGVVYANIETTDGGTVRATQFFSAEQVQPIAVEDYDGTISLNDRVITVTYVRSALPYQQVTSLADLKNYKLYQIKNKNGLGYLAYNSTITEEYVSVRGATNFPDGNPDETVKAKYQEEVSAFDETTVWQIILEEGKYYLYQPERKAYVTRSGRDYKFTTTKTALDGIHVNSGNHAGTFSFHAGGGYSDDSKSFACITNNENSIALRNWTWEATGAVMQIIENPNVYALDYAVEITGHPDGAIIYNGAEHANGATIAATEFYTEADVEVKALPNSTYEMTFDKENQKITVVYTRTELPCQQVTSLDDLKNYKLYQIKNKNGEGYLAWNHSITDTYLSIRGVTNFGSGEPAADIRAQYAEAVSPFDENTVWQIIQEEGKYYLYHPARKAYVTRSGRDYQFTDTKTALDGIRVNGDGTFSFHAGGGYSESSQSFACIVTNSTPMAVRNWTWNDHGSVMQIIENPNVYLLDYAVEVLGAEEGGILFDGDEYADGETFTATEFVQGADFTAIEVDGKVAIVNVESSTIYVSYIDAATQFYTIKNGKGGYVSLNAAYTDGNGNLKLNNTTAVADEKGYWAFEPQGDGGYKIYNYTTGRCKVLGMTGSEANARASMVPYDSDTHTTTFYGAIDLENSANASYLKLTSDGNNYWNNRDGFLALWNDANAYNNSDTGSQFYLTKVEVVGFSEAVAIGEHKIATFYANTSARIPEGVKAYVATAEGLDVEEGTLTMTEITDGIIPAETGVVLRGAEGNYSFIYTAAAGTPVAGNLLRGYAGAAEYADVALPEDGSVNYVLTVKDGNAGFYRKEAGFKVYNHKAYLNVPATGEGAPALTIRFEGDGSTGIEKSEIINHKSDMIYDLMGRCVENPTKGVYIVGGRKVVIK